MTRQVLRGSAAGALRVFVLAVATIAGACAEADSDSEVPPAPVQGDVAHPSYSAEVSLDVDSSRYTLCMNKAITNADFAACGGAELSKQEQALVRAWQSARAHFAGTVQTDDAETAQSLAALEQEQEAWKAYADKACEFWRYGNGREGQVVHYPECKSGVVSARIDYLNGLIQGPE